LGELAQYFAATKIMDLQLKISPVQNWQRNQIADVSGYNFYPTSPAIRNIETALLYPGLGLLEGINVNEGRGTDKPFCLFGAPWVNADELLNIFVSKKMAGISATLSSFIPTDSLYKGELCNGLELDITDKNNFKPVNTGIEILRLLIQLYPSHVQERLYKTNANPSGKGHLDKLLGIQNAFEKIKAGDLPDTDVSGSWPSEMNPYLLYS
jgi:uncharacterized protein YbbC (DUF1343 family)